MGCTPWAALEFAEAHPDIDLQGQTAAGQNGSNCFRSSSIGGNYDDIWYMKCKVHVTNSWVFFGIAADIDVKAVGADHHNHLNILAGTPISNCNGLTPLPQGL